MINTLGIVCAQNAIANGPAGPASAISGTNYIMFTIIEALRNKTRPRTLEIWGLVISMLGALIVVEPQWFERGFKKIKSLCEKVRNKNFNQAKLEE